MQVELRRFGWLVGAVDAGKVLQLSPPRLRVKPLRIALFTNFNRRVNEYFQKFSLCKQSPREPAFRAIRRDERNQHDQAGIHHQLCDFGDTANVFHAIRFGKSQIAAKAMAYVVSIQNIRVLAGGMQARFQEARNSGFSRAGETGEPYAARGLAADRPGEGAIVTWLCNAQ